MNDNLKSIEEFTAKLQVMLNRQNYFAGEINNLFVELSNLKLKVAGETLQTTPQEVIQEVPKPLIQPKPFVYSGSEETKITAKKSRAEVKTPEARPGTNVEKFIGESVVSKIGIAITIIGIGIGTKYSIEHNLISPVTRIILGYLMGMGLLVVGMKLKLKYKNFSAVLVSGSMAIMYLVTFSAYSMYGLIPQVLAFVLMVIFTGFTVFISLKFDMQIIAHIGLVGAYAVPFLLSDGSGRVSVLFSYMAIINIGILVLSFRRYWKSLFYAAFAMTWLIYLYWFGAQYIPATQFSIASAFLCIFFVIFYICFLSYKLIKNEKFGLIDIFLVLINAFIFYATSYALINENRLLSEYSGLLTMFNGLIHFIVSVYIYLKKNSDKTLFYMTAGLVLVFVTIAIPVQLDGNWVTMLWTLEAALLFRIGRSKKVKQYEFFSYALMALATFSLLHDWFNAYGFFSETGIHNRFTILFNIHFLTSLIFILAYCYILFINRTISRDPDSTDINDLDFVLDYIVPGSLICIVYLTFYLEISHDWDRSYLDSATIISRVEKQTTFNMDIPDFKNIWLINYSLFYLIILSAFNILSFKNIRIAQLCFYVIYIAVFVFLVTGLFSMGELRERYLDKSLPQYFTRSFMNIAIRYVSYPFAAASIYTLFWYSRKMLISTENKIAVDLVFHISVLWVSSSELINWMDLAGSTQTYKLGLSILWGAYSLMLIFLGIHRRKKYLRFGAFLLFTITLGKLFFYDLADLDTIAKTIVFVSLGMLLLSISFLYNKYKDRIANETSN